MGSEDVFKLAVQMTIAHPPAPSSYNRDQRAGAFQKSILANYRIIAESWQAIADDANFRNVR